MTHTRGKSLVRVGVILALVAGTFVAQSAGAHVRVKKTFPAKGGTECTSVPRARVVFDDPITRGKLRVFRFDGVKVSAGAGGRARSGSNRLIAELKADQLLPGRYKAMWRSEALDGHRKKGKFGFRLRDCAPPPPIGPSLKLVGYNWLGQRGMNAALAIHGDYAYIGSRTDGKTVGSFPNVNNAGVMIVNISDPSNPTIAGQMMPPLEGNPQESSRELRVWRSQDVLIVLHTNCGGAGAHNCLTPSINNFRFYDISGANATNPQLLAQFDENTHEFFLWEDPNDPERALVFGASAGSDMQIWDISPVLQGGQPVTLYDGPHGFTSVLPHDVTIDPPSTAAGTYQAAEATFGPAPTAGGIAGSVVLVNDGTDVVTDGCQPLVGFPSGAIALVDRGTCTFTQKAVNAQAAGAVAMIVVNDRPGQPTPMTGTDPTITIPSVMVSQDEGTTIKGGLPATGRIASSSRVPIPAGGVHSFSVNNAGTRAYYALLTGGFGIVDVSDFTQGVATPQLRLVTENENRPFWPGPGAHSAIKLWNKDWVYVSDEVYGTITAPGHGCPWGWARMVDISDPTTPTVEAEYKLEQNRAELCGAFEPRPRTSYSAHNPTATPNIVFTTWHSGGFQAIDVSNPAEPKQLAEFFPDPPDFVHMEDPRLSSDPDTGLHEKVVMWSYPIIKDGLIYVVDLRNGLYVLKYEGPFQEEVDEITFLEGNSNQGHALCYEPVGPTPGYC
jgi:methionine-rich copper-binding protein CopC